jgi:PAS domain-containing protein
MLDGGNGGMSKAVAADALKRLRTSLADVEAVEQALRSQVMLYESVLASLVEGIAVQDLTGKVVAFNASALRILGVTAEQLSRRTSLDPVWAAVNADGSPFPAQQTGAGWNRPWLRRSLAPSAAVRCSVSSSPTSTSSRLSTIDSAMPPATRRFGKWPAGSGSTFARATWWPGSAVTSSPSCSRA